MRRLARRSALVASVALAVVLVLWGVAGRAPWSREFRLPTRLPIEETVEDLLAGFSPTSVVAQRADAPVTLDALQPSPDGQMTGAYRRAIVAPPPTTVRFRIRVPAGGTLRFGAGVEGDGHRDATAGGVRFAVSVDGREVFSRVVNPAVSRGDRHWFDERVDLAAQAERQIEVVLRTEAERDAPRLAGKAGWSQLRVVRELERTRQEASPSAPNVLILLVDALRPDRLGCYGASPSPSPTLDALAAAGTVFDDAVAQSSWTMPAVATIFSGLHPRSHGVQGIPRRWAVPQGMSGGDEWGFLPDGVRTLAECAEEAGITTMGVATNPLVSRATNYAQGFETFVEFGWNSKGHRWSRAPDVNASFLRWLRENREHRFLGYLHYMDVHDPYTPPPELRPPPPPAVRPAIARGDIDAFARKAWHEPGQLSAAEVDYIQALYTAAIRSWDAELRRLLEALGGLGLRESTIIVVLADHGEEFQEHRRLAHGSQLYDEVLRIPLIVAGPSIGHARVRWQAQEIDLLPTVAAMLGLPPPPGLPGRDLFSGSESRPAFVETRYGVAPDGSDTDIVAVRGGDWKLIHMPTLARSELYDLARDPGEHENRFGTAPEGAALAERLAAWQTTAPPPPLATGRDPQLEEKLRALGYVE